MIHAVNRPKAVEHDALLSSVFLGAGGPTPSLFKVGREAGRADRLLELPEGQSVYAIDMDAEARRVAIGARAGRIDFLSLADAPEGISLAASTTLNQGAPILSVCLLGGERLASTDTAGRCLLWHPLDAPNDPKSLETGGEIVCSLLRLDEGRMLGLSAVGKLLIWDIEDGRLVQSLDAPAPPAKLGLVRLAHWPHHDVAVYPASDGRMASFHVESQEVEVHAAHEGTFYVAMVVGDVLYTIGKEDGRLKVWGCPGHPPSEDHAAPEGIVSGEVLSAEPVRVVLVHENGEAAICSVESTGLVGQTPLDGAAYRVARGPAPEVRQTHDRRQRFSRCERLCMDIRAKMVAGESESLDVLHHELESMGFERLSLALRAQQAAHQEDFIGELRIRRQLCNSLQPDQPEASASWARYAELLDRTWQPAEARRIYSRIHFEGIDKARREWLDRVAPIMEGKDWVIEPDMPIPILIEAATVLKKSFRGRWVLDTAKPVTFPDGELSADILAAKYLQVIAADGREGFPGVTSKGSWWVSRSETRETCTILFDRPPNESGPGRRLMIRIENQDIPTVLTPLIVFDVASPAPGRSIEEHNRAVAEEYERILRSSVVSPWLKEVLRLVSEALRRLRTLALAGASL